MQLVFRLWLIIFSSKSSTLRHEFHSPTFRIFFQCYFNLVMTDEWWGHFQFLIWNFVKLRKTLLNILKMRKLNDCICFLSTLTFVSVINQVLFCTFLKVDLLRICLSHGAAEEGANPKVRRLKKWTCHILVHTMHCGK